MRTGSAKIGMIASKALFEGFTQFRTLRLTERQIARTDSLRRNAHWIRHLRYFPYDKIMDPTLQEILVSLDAATVSHVDFEAMSALIQENPRLQRINTRGGGSNF
ncbi:hypothetical protein DFQ26_004515 [Actinomortierella ambigua]|nr:hypothetical protein DFQ26_004515 [Actinomortierella ambigua]